MNTKNKLPDDHGPDCLRAWMKDDWDKMCEVCEANRVAEEYIVGVETRDHKLMEAVWLAAQSDDMLRKELEAISRGALDISEWDDYSEQVVRDAERRHEYLMDKVKADV